MNPYEPSFTAEIATATKSPTLRLLGRTFVILYAFLFSAICMASLALEFEMPTLSYFENGVWLIVDLLTCFGVFALAFPLLRLHCLSLFWQYFSVALPFAFLAGVIRELPSIVGDLPEFAGVELWLFSIFFFACMLVLFGPAVAFNFVLSSKLKNLAEANSQ